MCFKNGETHICVHTLAKIYYNIPIPIPIAGKLARARQDWEDMRLKGRIQVCRELHLKPIHTTLEFPKSVHEVNTRDCPLPKPRNDAMTMGPEHFSSQVGLEEALLACPLGAGELTSTLAIEEAWVSHLVPPAHGILATQPTVLVNRVSGTSYLAPVLA